MSHLGREVQKYYFLAIWCVSGKSNGAWPADTARSALAFIQDLTVGTFSCHKLRLSKSGKHRKASGAI